MQQEIERFLNLKHLPARMTAEQAAAYMGFSPHEIPILMAKGLLKPLGHPAPNGQKFFLTASLEEMRRDEKWFARASDTIGEYWRYKNGRKSEDTATGRPQPTQSAGARRYADADD